MSDTNHKHLKLSKDKKVLGLVSGISDYTGFDRNLARLIAVIIIVLTGIIPGLIMYLIFASILKHEG